MDLVPPSLSHSGLAMVAAFVAVALWEHVRPERPPPVASGPRWRVNLALFAIRKLIALMLAPLIVATAAIAGPGLLPAAETGIGTLAHAAAVLLALDFGHYLAHRALHAAPWLWRLHAVHHTDLDLDVTTSVRGHPGESILVGLWLAILGALLGARPDEVTAYAALLFIVQLVAHANVRLPRGVEATLSRWMITPTFHRLHHSRDGRESHANFGAVLAIWDRLLGSAIAPVSVAPSAYGVGGYLDPRSQRLVAVLMQPLRAPVAGGGLRRAVD
jgi:sterol desaturase/sphingolipid hydroxylase (fatty acid hydroxylase superfamily)